MIINKQMIDILKFVEKQRNNSVSLRSICVHLNNQPSQIRRWKKKIQIKASRPSAFSSAPGCPLVLTGIDEDLLRWFLELQTRFHNQRSSSHSASCPNVSQIQVKNSRGKRPSSLTIPQGTWDCWMSCYSPISEVSRRSQRRGSWICLENRSPVVEGGLTRGIHYKYGSNTNFFHEPRQDACNWRCQDYPWLTQQGFNKEGNCSNNSIRRWSFPYLPCL